MTEATVFFLVRHALCDPVGVTIAGRGGAVPLNAAGRRQASSLAERLREVEPHALYSSPLDRALQTAEAIARVVGLDVVTDDAFTEVDFGGWTGERLSDLAERSEWRRFNQLRSWAQVPDGELMISAQARAVAGLARLRVAHPGNRVVIVTHADVVRGVLTHAVGAPLDMLLRFECDAASVSVVTLDNDNVRVLRVNDSGSLAGL